MVVVKIQYKLETKKVDVDMTKLLMDVLKADPQKEGNAKRVIRRINEERFESAFGMAWAGIAPKGMSEYEFALRYGKDVN